MKNFKRGLFFICSVLTLVYILYKSKNPQMCSIYFIVELFITFCIGVFIWGLLYLDFQSKVKYSVLNLITSTFLIGYLGFVFLKQNYLIDKINFLLIVVSIIISFCQNISALRKT
jgi:hypothetical protein